MTTAFEGSYGLRLSLMRHIAIISIFLVIVAKMETITKWMLVLAPPLTQCCLGKERELYMLVFRPRQLWIGGGEGSYFFYLGGMVVWHKSDKINGTFSSGLSWVVDLSTLQRQYFSLSFSPFWNTTCPLRFHYTKQCAPPVGSDFQTCAQRSFTRLHHLLSFLLL